MTAVIGWYRRTYDDRRYVDGARHAVVGMPIDTDAVDTACGRRMARTTSAKVANRLVPSPMNAERSDIRTCQPCTTATKGGPDGTSAHT